MRIFVFMLISRDLSQNQLVSLPTNILVEATNSLDELYVGQQFINRDNLEMPSTMQGG